VTPVANGGAEMPATRRRPQGSGSDTSQGAEPSSVASTAAVRQEPTTLLSSLWAAIRPYQW
jgi:hypothetical protein